MISPIAASAGSSRPASDQQHLERAAVAAVGVLAFEHVEAQLAGQRGVARAWHELEARALVDEAADQPGRGDAVDLHALARHPYAPLQPGRRVCRDRSAVRSFCHGLVLLLQAGFQARDQTLRRFARRRRRRSRWRRRHRAACAAAPSGSRSRPAHCRAASSPRRLASSRASAAMRCVVLVTRRIEQRLQLAIGQPVDQGRLADDRLAAALDDLLGKPGEVLARLDVRRQRIDRALHRDRAQRLQAAPDLDPRIGGLGRQLMDQQQPGRTFRGLITCHCASVSY